MNMMNMIYLCLDGFVRYDRGHHHHPVSQKPGTRMVPQNRWLMDAYSAPNHPHMNIYTYIYIYIYIYVYTIYIIEFHV